MAQVDVKAEVALRLLDKETLVQIIDLQKQTIEAMERTINSYKDIKMANRRTIEVQKETIQMLKEHLGVVEEEEE